MSLLAAIPGLSAHETAVSAAPAPVVAAFDNAAAIDAVRAAILEVAAAFPAPDPWGWLVANRPDVIAELKKSGKDIDAAYAALDMPQLTARVSRFVRLHLRAWDLYAQRPPVIEVQEDLL